MHWALRPWTGAARLVERWQARHSGHWTYETSAGATLKRTGAARASGTLAGATFRGPGPVQRWQAPQTQPSTLNPKP